MDTPDPFGRSLWCYSRSLRTWTPQTHLFPPISIELGLDPSFLYLGMVRPRPGESLEDAEQQRQKRRHDPHTQREDAPRNPPRELRPRHRAGKEPAGSSSKEPRKAPYILQSRAAAPPSRPTPTSKGIAHDICPKTPPRLVVEYSPGQHTYPNILRLHRPGIVPGFTVEMERNY